jgi:hypothetical protein
MQIPHDFVLGIEQPQILVSGGGGLGTSPPQIMRDDGI